MNVTEVIAGRGIEEVLHFTTNHGLTGILRTGAIMSRKRLPDEDRLVYIFEPNAKYRRDIEWLNYVNLSISDINWSFFNIAANKWYKGTEKWWCILSFRPEIMEHEGVIFSTTNNKYDACKREAGYSGLEALFGSPIIEYDSGDIAIRGTNHLSNRPTSNQAEVLYPKKLSIDFLQKIYVRHEEELDALAGIFEFLSIPPVNVELAPGRFLGEQHQ
ncbi:MAG: DUF4433 domain-containing protein [endosymbiont of Seepiophila jonesi]|uniref:DUF4433 domain-containing protein n=1 Tax=endosymbiont of Lamellibrachia luymesi TaxID=2200907 RepID=A0A370DW72_9GAMM|nr:MAG: DUF4433 domain-containing protein [endosymbiont of Lamellibrachia luymesi]RDH94284.1 MAG: DUF4433 domain-containing protein [endosymbiont of Seepiophila jonesi]